MKRAPVYDRIICAGRQLDDTHHTHPVGEPCGRVYHHRCSACIHIADDTTWQRVPNEVHAQVIAESARAAGWRLGPERPDGTRDAMCRQCGRPDPTMAGIVRDLLDPGRT